eukprot:234807-Chlamydomonas_euryale.AAC.3
MLWRPCACGRTLRFGVSGSCPGRGGLAGRPQPLHRPKRVESGRAASRPRGLGACSLPTPAAF